MNSSADTSAAARRIIAGGVVWEGCVGWTVECLPYTDGVLHKYRDAGFNHVSLTIAAEWNGVESAMRHLGRVRNWLTAQSDQITTIATADDIDVARAAGKLAVSFNFQGSGPFANDPNLIEIYARLGVKIVILNYNSRNALGDGCQEPGNGGLSMLGHRFVQDMNRVGVLIDLSHVGERTAIETIAASRDPVLISHSNPHALHPHARNVSDAMIQACAAKGGVIGLNSLSFMLDDTGRSTVPRFVDHIEHVATLVGPLHVGLGMDWNFYDPFMQAMYAQNPAMKALGYPAPPWDSLAPDRLPEIVDALLARGWSDAHIHGLLGANLMRVARVVWR